MRLKSLKLLNFKNIEEARLDFSGKLNCFTGKNGAGKTNLLDAIYYLSSTKSYFNTPDQLNIKETCDFFSIEGIFDRLEKEDKIYCAYSNDKKKIFKRNDKSYHKYSDHIGLIPIVMVTPGDSELITGTGEERRKYLDNAISQYDREYLHELIRYNAILFQRNKLLKNYQKNSLLDIDTIEIYNEQLDSSGKLLYTKRRQLIEELLPLFEKYYSIISKKNENVSFEYQTHLDEDTLYALLNKSIEKDKILGFTSKGIHRDDLIFTIENAPLKKSGSQGQQKTFLTALKFAQFEFIKKTINMNPLLLLDDIFDKFDSERVEEIIRLTAANGFGQIFLTDTNPVRVQKLIEKEGHDYKLFNVVKGQAEEVTL
jgi:DNA replication and repair protein RecF